MASMGWFLEKMERERESFACEQIYAPSRLTAFRPWIDFLSEDEENLSRRSASAKCIRRRVKSLLIDIHTTVCVEVFALATFSASMSKLYKVEAKTVLPELRTWWTDATHPESLVSFSKDLAKEFDITQIIPVPIKIASSSVLPDYVLATGKKRRFSETSFVGV
jgi:hypothetical protein